MDSARFEIYHKSKFVPGAEALPTYLFFLNGWFDSFGAANGSYTPQDERAVFKTFNRSYAVAPAICYESIFGEFMAEYVRRGANMIAIITNDGWWGDTPGYRQHENYARLRAIETRKWVLRSANTGISCFIDPTGTIIDPQPWDKKTSIKMDIPTNSQQTFFVKHGDLISRIAILAAILIIIWNIWTIIKRKMNRA
jgi:apolipoprotein N-acyltransferase